MRVRPACIQIALGALLLCRCASTDDVNGDDPGDGRGGAADLGVPAGRLLVVPDPVLAVTAGEEKKVDLKVTSPTAGDVTDKVSWALGEPAVGAAQGGTLTVRAGLTRGYRTTLTATYGAQAGTASLIVKRVAGEYLDPQAPRNPQTYFGLDQTGARPAWSYPLAGALLPRNLDPPLLQWSGTADALVYRLQIDCAAYAQTLYLSQHACSGTRCQFAPLAPEWRNLSASCAGDSVSLTVAASPGLGLPIGTDGPLKLQLTAEDTRGVLYYWSSALNGPYRQAAGSGKRHAFITNGNTYGCAGCHVISRDGARVALSFMMKGSGLGGVVSGRNGAQYLLKPPAGGRWEMATFSPGADMLLVSLDGDAWVIDPERGDTLYTLPRDLIGGAFLQPDWSPDGRTIVFVRVQRLVGRTFNAVNAGDIMLVPFSGGQFGVPELLVAAVPGAEYHFHPSFTPDGKWVLFNTGKVPCNQSGTDCNLYDARNTFLRIVRAQGGGRPVDLQNARQKANTATNWPRAAPFLQDGDRLLYFSFSTRAAYGFAKPGDEPNLWMSALDLSRLENQPGLDPSYPPFWVPGQKPGETNVMGAWTQQLGCESMTDCPSGYACTDNHCQAPLD